MRKALILLAAGGSLGGLGCSRSLSRARANYYQQRAERAEEHGRYDKAAKEEHKAARANEDAYSAPLP